jgi:hypothetical protein
MSINIINGTTGNNTLTGTGEAASVVVNDTSTSVLPKTVYGSVHAQLAYSGDTPVIFEM